MILIKSYSELYLPYVAENLGTMLEYAVDSGINEEVAWNTFVNSNVAKQIEKGNPKYLSCSAIDYFNEIFEGAIIESKQNIDKDKYYWAGWIIAQFQHKTGYSFYKINNAINICEVLNLYPTLHEADKTKFFDIASCYFQKEQITNLKKIRSAMGLSQNELANLSGVDLRSIQMYEQRKNDINKAKAETLYKLSRILGCNIDDLLEI
ncbi:MAG: helix-turn-helix transcriptional regulator [Clostridia bacterium]|nr:helix-turn-helix transcriptional regulator [Clostridia bacterium]